MASNTELTGKIVKADKTMVWVDHMGAVVPLKIDQKTKFEGTSLTHAKDLKEGQEIRANFEVKNKTSNVAKSISLSSDMESGKGGSGLDTGMENTPPGGDSSMNGTGGSGMNPSDATTAPAPIDRGPTSLPEEPGTNQNGVQNPAPTPDSTGSTPHYQK